MPHEAFQAFSRQVFADGALPEKTKQLIAVAVAHVTQCPYCIRSHTRIALREGATEQEIMEVIWVAARYAGSTPWAACTLDEVDGAPRITTIELTVRARVPGLDKAALQRNVAEAADLCPVSNALRGSVAITVRDELDAD